MSLGITFGSIGDLIAVGQIAWSLAQAVSSTRGSAKEFQGLINELKTFNKVLLQVVAIWQNYESSPELDVLGKITKEQVKEWQDSLWAFRLRFEKKYGASLQPGGSGNWAKDTSKKILWLREKDDIIELRRKISTASGMINLLVLAAIGTSNKLDDTTQRTRIDGVHFKLNEATKLAEDQNTHLQNLHQKMDVQSQSSDLILNKMTKSISTLAQVKSNVIDIKGLLEFFRAQIFMSDTTPRGLDTTWKEAPVTLEDALGNLVPIPLQLINSWDMFEIVLAKRFETKKGHQKVLRKEYAVEDGRSGMEVSREREWSLCFRPGQKINMVMVFKQFQATTFCPGCKTEAVSVGESIIQCKECQMWFQLVEEIAGPSQHPAFPETEFFTPQARPSTSQINTSEIIEDSPSDFQRVRLLYQSNKWGDSLKNLNPILFVDSRGRKFSFPFHLCHHWPGMAQLVTELFQYDMSAGSRVAIGQYDIVGPGGNVISHQDWDATIEPGASVTMHMWPLVDSDSSAEPVGSDDLLPVLGPKLEVEETKIQANNDSSKDSDAGHSFNEGYGEDSRQERSETPKVQSSITNKSDIMALGDAPNGEKGPTVKPKSILRGPRIEFSEDGTYIRATIAPRGDLPTDKEILQMATERRSATGWEEIVAYAVATDQIRKARSLDVLQRSELERRELEGLFGDVSDDDYERQGENQE